MSGVPDNKRTSASGDEGPSQKSARSSSTAQAEPSTRSSWCSSCWAKPDGGACSTSGHRLLSVSAAQQELKKTLADEYQQLADLKLAIKTNKARLASVMEAGERLAVMFSVAGQEPDYASLEGGEVTLKLPHIDGGLSNEEKASIISALEGAELDNEPVYDDDDEMAEPTIYASISLNTGEQALRESVLEKLPLCVEGQVIQRGTALLRGVSCVELISDTIEAQEEHLTRRILGRMASRDLDKLLLNVEEEEEMYIIKHGRCKADLLSTEISDVRFR